MNEKPERISVNARAVPFAEQMIAEANALGVRALTLPNGTKVIDATDGGLRAGKLFAEACMGGLGEWAIKVGKFFAMGSGPARALSLVEELYQKLSYQDESDVAVIALEGKKLPTEEAADYIAEKCGGSPEKLYILIAPTASVVGSVQIAARVVETGMHKMTELGFDIERVSSGYGTCPIAPVAEDDLKAIGRTNDCVLYGGRAFYTVRTEDEEIERIINDIPSSASRDYGRPFYEIFQACEGDFYQIDPFLFSPAEVFVNNLTSGRTYHTGRLNVEMLRGVLG